MKKKAILFDLDGTLFDSEQLSYVSFEKTLQTIVELGLYPKQNWTQGMYKHAIGMMGKEIFKTLMPEASDDVHLYAAKILGEVEDELLETEGMLFPEVKETLACLHQKGYLLYTASNGGATYVPRVTEIHGIRPLFQKIYCAGLQQTANKVDLVKLIIQEIGLEAVMVGDRYSDIEAGKKNKLQTVACAFGFGMEEEIREADFIIREFSELLKVID